MNEQQNKEKELVMEKNLLWSRQIYEVVESHDNIHSCKNGRTSKKGIYLISKVDVRMVLRIAARNGKLENQVRIPAKV